MPGVVWIVIKDSRATSAFSGHVTVACSAGKTLAEAGRQLREAGSCLLRGMGASSAGHMSLEAELRLEWWTSCVCQWIAGQLPALVQSELPLPFSPGS